MKTGYTIIKVDGTREREVADLPLEPSYHDLRVLMGDIFWAQRPKAHFERVAVIGDEGQPADMFVDEDGHRHGLPINEEATRVYHRVSLARNTEPEKTKLLEEAGLLKDGIITCAPKIAGVAILFDRRVWF